MNSLFLLIALAFVVMLSMPCYFFWKHHTWERDQRKRVERYAAERNKTRSLYIEKGWEGPRSYATPVKAMRVRTGPFSYEWRVVDSSDQ